MLASASEGSPPASTIWRPRVQASASCWRAWSLMSLLAWTAARLASFLHLGEQYFVLLLLAVNVFLQMWHVLLWFAMSCRFLLCGPFDGVALADAVGGDGVVAAVFDVACLGCVVDGLVVDAGEGFGLAEGDHVWVPGVDGFGGHGVSFGLLDQRQLRSWSLVLL